MSHVVLLAPHNDDEALFAAFQILRVKPHVIVCTRSVVQEQRGYTFQRDSLELPITPMQREIETMNALSVLGAEYWEQWHISDGLEHNVGESERMIQHIKNLSENYYHVIAPAHEEGGHFDHNFISTYVRHHFDARGEGDRVTQYLTYTKAGRSRNGQSVPFEPHWPALKMRALACYESQIQHPSTRDHFMGDLWEWQL